MCSMEGKQMKKVSIQEQKKVYGGGHWHWKCSVTPFVTPTKFSSAESAWYNAGIHAQKYGHKGKMSVFPCVCK